MPSSMFFPLDNIQPSEILGRYSEWIYFTLILVFFISISGVALRKHFDKPYVKPLIISVGLMLTFGAFRFRTQLTSIIDTYAILGSILLVVIVATIPYGLCRGFGMQSSKAFFLSFILIYILSWVKLPEFHRGLAEQNLGLVNLALLIFFFVAIFKVFKPGKLPSIMSKGPKENSQVSPEIEREYRDEDQEGKLITGQAEKMTKLEIRSMEDIVEAIDQILKKIESHRNNLPQDEREKISSLLNRIIKDEDIFKKYARRIRGLFQRLGAVEAQHFKELKDRLEKSSGKEKKLVKSEIEKEEEKLKIERAIFEFERKLTQALNSFNQHLKSAIEHIRNSPYPYDGVHPLSEAKKVLSNIVNMAKEMGELEEKFVSLVNAEKKLLKKESTTT